LARLFQAAIVFRHATAVAEIKAAAVSTLGGICECLNRRGIATRNEKNWCPAAVRNVLRTWNG